MSAILLLAKYPSEPTHEELNPEYVDYYDVNSTVEVVDNNAHYSSNCGPGASRTTDNDTYDNWRWREDG